jgi:hypothetical protein
VQLIYLDKKRSERKRPTYSYNPYPQNNSTRAYQQPSNSQQSNQRRGPGRDVDNYRSKEVGRLNSNSNNRNRRDERDDLADAWRRLRIERSDLKRDQEEFERCKKEMEDFENQKVHLEYIFKSMNDITSYIQKNFTKIKMF